MSHPFPIFGESDNHDDDGQVLDDLLTDTHQPADIRGAIEPVEQPADPKPVPVTRLYATSLQYAASSAAVVQPLMNEDLKRKQCRIRVRSAAASPSFADYVIISDEKGKISAGSSAIAITAMSGDEIVLEGHTGALYVINSSGLTGAMNVTAWSVTQP